MVLIQLSIYAALSLAIASLLALRGTNDQAQMSKARWRADKNPHIVRAAQLWAPGPRWIRRRAYRQAWQAEENAIAKTPNDWARYQMLRREFRAWNDLETAVAMALPASVIGAVVAIAASLK